MATVAAPGRSGPVLSRKARIRLFWLKLHRWIGLATLVVMAAFGITGSVLVWPDTFDAMLHPGRYTNADASGFVPTEAFLDKARAALPAGDRISGLRVTESGAVMVAGDVNGPPPAGLGPPSRAQVWLHPGTGAVLDTSAGAGGFIWAMHAIHGHLLLKTVGREAVALSGVILLATSAIGVWLWWPGRRNLLRALAWRKQYSKSMNLHRQTGAVLAVVIILEAATGTWIALPRLFGRLVEPSVEAARAPTEGPPVSAPMARPMLSVDDAVHRAAGALPGAGPLVTVFTPGETNPVWAVSLRTPSGPATVLVDDTDGSTTVREEPAPGRAERVTAVMEAIHFGHGPAVWTIIVFASGIVLTLLSVTGLLIWLQERARRMRRAAKA